MRIFQNFLQIAIKNHDESKVWIFPEMMRDYDFLIQERKKRGVHRVVSNNKVCECVCVFVSIDLACDSPFVFQEESVAGDFLVRAYERVRRVLFFGEE